MTHQCATSKEAVCLGAIESGSSGTVLKYPTLLKGRLQSGTKQKQSGLYGSYRPSLSTLLLPP